MYIVSWMLLVLLHLLPIVVVAATWKQPWSEVFEKTVRIQVVATLVYLMLAPVVCMMEWPGFSLSFITLANIVSFWEGEGLWNVLSVVSATAVTGAALCLRRKATV